MRSRTRLASACLALLAASLAAGEARAGRVAAGTVNGQGVFVEDGRAVTLRGVNFDREATHVASDGRVTSYHVNFDPGAYDAVDVAGELSAIAASGYGVVRVNVSSLFTGGGYGGRTQPGVDAAWLADLRDFLEDADRDGLQVLLTGDSLPSNYDSYLRDGAGTEDAKIAAANVALLSPGFALGLARNWVDILTGLAATSRTALAAIMAIEAQNEAFVMPNCAPFTADACVRDADGAIDADPGPPIARVEIAGTEYDMGSASSRQELVDAGTFRLIRTVRDAVRAIDPSILVGLGAFPIDRGVGPGATFDGVYAPASQLSARYPVRPFMVGRYSEADFVDLHVYPQAGAWSLGRELAVEEIGPATLLPKPLMMGEYGASVTAFPVLAQAGDVLATEPAESCGFGFSGWLLWTWDTTSPRTSWTAKEAGGYLNGIVAPRARPRICPAIPAGLFQVPPAVGYSNGAAYCLFADWADYVRATGRTDLRGVASYPRPPLEMGFAGACQAG